MILWPQVLVGNGMTVVLAAFMLPRKYGRVTRIKQPTRCSTQSQNLLPCRTDTAQHVSGVTMPIIGNPSNCRCSLCFPYECGGGSVLSRGRFVSYGKQRLQRQFDGLLMMGIVMPETCWAVSVQQSNKILRLIVASSWVFYLSKIDQFFLILTYLGQLFCIRTSIIPVWILIHSIATFLYVLHIRHVLWLTGDFIKHRRFTPRLKIQKMGSRYASTVRMLNKKLRTTNNGCYFILGVWGGKKLAWATSWPVTGRESYSKAQYKSTFFAKSREVAFSKG